MAVLEQAGLVSCRSERQCRPAGIDPRIAAVDPLLFFGTQLRADELHQYLRTRFMQPGAPMVSGILLCHVFLGSRNSGVPVATPPHCAFSVRAANLQ
jgi:hypothetical protein